MESSRACKGSGFQWQINRGTRIEVRAGDCFESRYFIRKHRFLAHTGQRQVIGSVFPFQKIVRISDVRHSKEVAQRRGGSVG